MLSMILLFALALLAVYTGVAAIVGAFLAGMALGESTGLAGARPGPGSLRTAGAVLPGGHRTARRSLALSRSPRYRSAGDRDSRGRGRLQIHRLRPGRAGSGQGRCCSASAWGWCRAAKSAWWSRKSASASGSFARPYGVVVFMSVATTIVAPPLIKVAFKSVPREDDAETEEAVARLA